jgi:glucose/arabinose dehydrogenase
MGFAADGRIFFTERPGKLRVIENGKVREAPLLELPSSGLGEGGLLGLALDPKFADNGTAYVYQTYRNGDAIKNRVLRLSIKQDAATVESTLIDDIPGSSTHNGGRMKFGPDGLLYITTGDAANRDLAQQKDSLAGKILRLTTDGSVPGDNPFPGSPVYSWGHRNPQGLAWHPDTGALYSSEHGQSAHDELNLISPGANYGWPLIQGSETDTRDGISLKAPLVHSGNDTWGPSGMVFLTQGPWKGQLLVAALAGQQLLRVIPEADGLTASVSSLYREEWGRLRNVTEGPDGTLYILVGNRDGRGAPENNDDKLIALYPTWE